MNNSAHLQEFTYSGLMRLAVTWRQAGGILGIVVFNGIALIGLWATTQIEPPDPGSLWWNDPRSGPVCFSFWFVLISWLVGLTLINASPTVWLTDTGLVISAFLFCRITVPWSDILDVRVGGVPFGHDLVIARRITPFHVVYGWLYTLRLQPAFLIDRRIDDHDRLIREIEQRARRAGGVQ